MVRIKTIIGTDFLLECYDSRSCKQLQSVKISSPSLALASMAILAISLLGGEAKAIALIDNALINTIGCSSKLFLGTTRDVTSSITAGYVFETGPTAYKLDTVTIPLANGIFGGSFIGDPTTALVSLYKVDSSNQLIGGPAATAAQSFRITNQEECRVSTVNLAGFQVAANEKYFLGIGTADSMLWSSWPNSDLISTNGGVTIPEIQHGMRYFTSTGNLQDLPYYGNIQLSGTAIYSVPAPIPVLGFAAMLGYSRKLRLRIKTARSQSLKD
jgi:hypothetical protein